MTAFQCALGWSLPLSKGTKFVVSLPPPLPLCRTQSGGTVAARADSKAKGAHTSHSMFAKEPPEEWMAECREEWPSRLTARSDQEIAPQAQHSLGSSSSNSSATPTDQAAAPWEHSGNPLLAGCARPRCGVCGIILKTGEPVCPFCPAPAPGCDESAAEQRRRRRQAQMRLVSLRRGDIKPRPGEPQCLEILVAELRPVLQQPRGADGKFAPGSVDAPQAI